MFDMENWHSLYRYEFETSLDAWYDLVFNFIQNEYFHVSKC